jgi:hypothetical protein
MDNGVERRAARRFSMMLPVKVRYSAQEGVTEKPGETRDVSFRGLYFLIEASLETGSPIEFVLTLPQQITLAGDVHIRCYARVLRVEPHNGQRGVAARIERYEFLPASACRLSRNGVECSFRREGECTTTIQTRLWMNCGMTLSCRIRCICET